MSYLLPLQFQLTDTIRFKVIELANIKSPKTNFSVYLNYNCGYTDRIITSAISRRPWCRKYRYDVDDKVNDTTDSSISIQISDFENISWDNVLRNKCCASSYLVRKGLSRKAQFSIQMKRYLSKHSESILNKSIPHTIVIETWNAFEDMKLEIGFGTFAVFDSPALVHAPLRQKLDWCLSDIRNQLEDDIYNNWTWILKPSVANKGVDITVLKSWDQIINAIESTPDMREWVLQKYIANPLLINGYKFHLRVYVLCVGALRVFVYNNMLMLLAAHKYDANDLNDIYKHLTNTARSAETIDYDEQLYVKTLSDLSSFLREEKNIDNIQSEQIVDGINSNINRIISDLFAAYENEYSVFCPMSNCFELYGLDFLVDDDYGVHLLEVNPGPDFKQTGDYLKVVIENLWEQVFRVVIDKNILSSSYRSHSDIDVDLLSDDSKAYIKDFTMVYSKEWSVSNLTGGMKLT